MNKFELFRKESLSQRDPFGMGEERLIDFSVLIIEIANELPNTKVGNHLSGQMVRSGTSPALNYGEALPKECLWQKWRIKKRLYSPR